MSIDITKYVKRVISHLMRESLADLKPNRFMSRRIIPVITRTHVISVDYPTAKGSKVSPKIDLDAKIKILSLIEAATVQ